MHMNIDEGVPEQNAALLGPKKHQLTKNWIKSHNRCLHDLYYSPKIVRRRSWRDM